MTQKLRSRAWTFTINNDTIDDLIDLIDLDYSYLIFGFEIGANGTHHIQGYLYFDNAISFSSIKNQLGRAHIEKSRGTPQQNIDYCSKDGDFYEFGTRPNQGQRNDLIEIRNRIKKNEPLINIADDFFNDFLRYHRGFDRYKELVDEKKLISDQPLEFKYVKNTEYIHNNDHFVATTESDLLSYNGEDTIVIYTIKGFNDYKLELLKKNVPYIVKKGYTNIRIKPNQLIIVY